MKYTMKLMAPILSLVAGCAKPTEPLNWEMPRQKSVEEIQDEIYEKSAKQRYGDRAGIIRLNGVLSNGIRKLDWRIKANRVDGKDCSESYPVSYPVYVPQFYTSSEVNPDLTKKQGGSDKTYLNLGCDSIDPKLIGGFAPTTLVESQTQVPYDEGKSITYKKRHAQVGRLFVCGEQNFMDRLELSAKEAFFLSAKVDLSGFTFLSDSSNSDAGIFSFGRLYLKGNNTITSRTTFVSILSKTSPGLVMQVDQQIIGNGRLEIHSKGADCNDNY